VADDSERQEHVALSLVYVGAEETPAVLCNHVHSQYHQDVLVVTFGQVLPPILIGTEQEQIDQAKQLSYVPVNVLARLGFTPDRLREVIDALQRNLDAYEAQRNTESG
jgi:hypothetical protein